MNNIVFITSRLDKKHGGLTASMLNKARILHEQKNVTTTILTFHADENFEEARCLINDRYDLWDKADIYNINDYFRERHVNYPNTKYTIKIDNYISVKINESTFEYYKNGMKELEILYNGNHIKEVKHFTESNNCFSKDILDNNGYLYMKNNYLNGYLSRQVFYRKDQTSFLTREFNALNKSNQIKSIILFEEETKRFSSFNQFKKYFINLFIKEPITYLVSETRGQDPTLLELDNPLAKKIFMSHSIHIRPGTDIIRTGNRPVLNNLNAVDALVLLTKKQKNDIINRFGYRNNYYVIPHSIELPVIKKNKVNNKVVIIARLHSEKRLEHCIRAFKAVVKSIPDAILQIYGDGDEKNKLQMLINELHLNKNVKLEGFSTNVDEILQSAECSLNTSYYEGFPLSIQESLSNGTPIIAYDIKYGPSDMIDHDKNGFLVEEGNIEDLSKIIIKYLSKSREQKDQYSNNAIEKAKLYSNKRFSDEWFNLFESLNKDSVRFNPSAKLLNVTNSKLNKLNYKINIDVKLNSMDQIDPIFKANFYHRSTLNDLEQKKHDTLNPKIISVKDDLYTLQVSFDAKKFKAKEIYDLSLSIQYESQYFDIRIGNNRQEININALSNKKCTPYFTENHDNLSFKL
ncbi:glycosyltransferase [Staphylococcus sp. 18_1_E_LY]|uniref:Glycosyltransferase n=1 Tax=Staphylococcus lloydii TaxID=2781774 RepID=A0A7T1B024_9STAP|nr:glycosyltransferase [Staphylococcus lloydii]MBF7019897.1 glycosyltransferase [Staphylococcus lloydii]MBF7027580.1 glycosyltransferase [Staphylococcus lloydii]QPM75268.1 glycosyltransferase [Staphylococcus lloydii]